MPASIKYIVYVLDPHQCPYDHYAQLVQPLHLPRSIFEVDLLGLWLDGWLCSVRFLSAIFISILWHFFFHLPATPLSVVGVYHLPKYWFSCYFLLIIYKCDAIAMLHTPTHTHNRLWNDFLPRGYGMAKAFAAIQFIASLILCILLISFLCPAHIICYRRLDAIKYEKNETCVFGEHHIQRRMAVAYSRSNRKLSNFNILWFKARFGVGAA